MTMDRSNSTSLVKTRRLSFGRPLTRSLTSFVTARLSCGLTGSIRLKVRSSFGRLWSTNVPACGTTSRRTQRPKRKRERNCKNSLGWQAPSLTTSFEKGLEEFLSRSLRKGKGQLGVERVAGMTKRKQGVLIYARLPYPNSSCGNSWQPQKYPVEAPYDLP